MKRGSQQTEKLHSLSANIFYPDPNEEEPERTIEDEKAFAENLNSIMRELLQVPTAEKEGFFNFVNQLYELKYQTIVEILEQTKTNKQVAEVLTQIDIDKLNKLNESASMLIVFLRHPQLFEQLQDLYKI